MICLFMFFTGFGLGLLLPCDQQPAFAHVSRIASHFFKKDFSKVSWQASWSFLIAFVASTCQWHCRIMCEPLWKMSIYRRPVGDPLSVRRFPMDRSQRGGPLVPHCSGCSMECSSVQKSWEFWMFFPPGHMLWICLKHRIHRRNEYPLVN